MKSTVATLASVCLVSLASAASADGIADGKAGAKALAAGSYAQAVRLFTHALLDKSLSAEDRELAYLERAKAHLGLSQKTLANADLRAALRLVPNDPEAAILLAGAKAPPAVAVVPPPPPSPWGAMEHLVGSWWLAVSTGPEQYIGYKWEVPQERMSFTGLDKGGNPIKGECSRDAASGAIGCLTVYRGNTVQSRIQPASDGYIEEGVQRGTQVRQTVQLENAGTFQQTTQAFQNGQWKVLKNVNLVRSSPEVIQALGWKESDGHSAIGSFLKGLGSSILGGAQAGLTDGVRDGVQARTAKQIAPK